MDRHHHYDSANEDEIEAIDNVPLCLLLLVLLHRRRRLRAIPTPTHRQWTGQEITSSLLNCGSPTRIHNALRMQLDTFYLLRDWLLLNTNRVAIHSTVNSIRLKLKRLRSVPQLNVNQRKMSSTSIQST
jgi:hypothetical protein